MSSSSLKALPNPHSIATARFALNSASWARGENPAIADEAVIDLLTDLMHFCAARRIDFALCSSAAADDFTAEMNGSTR
jgi:hypothetical protein